MRSSLLNRSVVAVASLAIGSVALAATPATAATPSGITRDMVLTAAAGARTATPTAAQSAAITDVLKRGCGIGPEDLSLPLQPKAVAAGDDADGVVLTAFVYSGPTQGLCTIGAFATVDASFQLSGTATITSRAINAADAPRTTDFSGPLSGDVYVTPRTDPSGTFATVSAAGNATKTTTTTTTSKVADKKTKAQKKAAKKKYDKRIKAAKKAYKKALVKAKSSKSKKAAAKKTYKAKRANAKAIYRKSIAGFKLVTRTTTNTENRPFSVTADASPFL